MEVGEEVGGEGSRGIPSKEFQGSPGKAEVVPL